MPNWCLVGITIECGSEEKATEVHQMLEESFRKGDESTMDCCKVKDYCICNPEFSKEGSTVQITGEERWSHDTASFKTAFSSMSCQNADVVFGESENDFVGKAQYTRSGDDIEVNEEIMNEVSDALRMWVVENKMVKNASEVTEEEYMDYVEQQGIVELTEAFFTSIGHPEYIGYY